MLTWRHLIVRHTLLLPLLLGVAPAVAQDNITPDPSLRLPRPPGTGLSPENKSFIEQAIGGANAAIAAGQLASRQADRDSVRRLGSEIAAEQQALRDALISLARDKNYQPSGTVPPALAPLEQIATATSKGDFDRQYLATQHQATNWLVAAYQSEMAATQDVDLRTFAATHLLPLRRHLDAIQKVAGDVGLQLEAPRNPPQY